MKTLDEMEAITIKVFGELFYPQRDEGGVFAIGNDAFCIAVSSEFTYAQLETLSNACGTRLINIEGTMDGGYYPCEARGYATIQVSWPKYETSS